MKNFQKNLILKAAHFLDKNVNPKKCQNRLMLHELVTNWIISKKKTTTKRVQNRYLRGISHA